MAIAAAIAVSVAAAVAAAQPSVQPWTEAVVSVRDLDRASELFLRDGGWRVTGKGAVDRSELAYWRLPDRASGQFMRICAPQANTGCIRFIRFSGVAQHPVRLAARPWDTGGIFSLMLRTTNLQIVFDRALAKGWWAETPIYAFEFGGSKLKNVVLTGPDGFNVALYERSFPVFTEYPLGLMGPAFNSMRMVNDQRISVAFYRDKLGFSQAFDSDYVDPAPGPNNFSIPQNYATKIIRRASAMHPVASGSGRIELMQFVGFTGRDLSADAVAPNLGILSVRFPVSNMKSYRQTLAARAVPLVQSGSSVKIAGLGNADIVAIRDPDGNLSEFFGVRP